MDNQETPYCQYYMPTGEPVPLVLDDEDLVTLLRLEKQGKENARWTLKYYRDKGLLNIHVGYRLICQSRCEIFGRRNCIL